MNLFIFTSVLRWLFIWYLSSITVLCGAQDYRVKVQHLGVRDGLVHNSINEVEFDKKGNLWIATDNGLSCYNGYEFINFSSSNTQLEGDNIREFTFLDDGRIALLTSAVTRMNQVGRLYFLDPELRQLVICESFSSGVWSRLKRHKLNIESLPSGFLVATDQNELWSFSLLDETWSEIDLPDDFEIEFCHANSVIGNLDGVLSYFHIEDPGAVRPLSAFFNSDAAPVRFQQTDYPQIPYEMLVKGYVRDSLEGINWFIGSDGLSGIFDNGKRVLFNDNSDSYSFPVRVKKLKEAPDGSLVLASERGLFIIRCFPSMFRTIEYRPDRFLTNRTFSSSCRGMTVIENILYVNDRNSCFKVPLDDTGKSEELIGPDINHSRLHPMLQVNNEIITGRTTLYKYNSESGMLDEMTDTLFKHLRGFWSLELNDNKLFIGTDNGAEILDYALLVDGGYAPVCDGSGLENLRTVYQVVPWEADTFFMVTSSGLYRFVLGDCDLQRVQFTDERAGDISYFQFTHMDRDDRGRWWLTSLDGGTMSFELKGLRAIVREQLNRDDGLITNTAYASYGDESDCRWISTDQGLVRWNNESDKYVMYTSEDGLPGNEFNRISHHRDDRGNLYFGGLSGVITFHPEEIPPFPSNLFSMRVLRVERFSSWRDTVENITAALLQTNEIVINPSDKFLRMEVGMEDYFLPDGHRFSYLIEGLQKDWQILPGNKITLGPLPYGSHKIRVRGQVASGLVSSDELQFTLIVKRPFYLSWWFQLILLFGVGITVREWWVSKTRRMKRHAALLEEQVAERTRTIAHQAEELRRLESMRSRFFANISHELRTPLTLIKGPVKKLLRFNSGEPERKYLEIIDRQAGILHDRIDDLLALSKADAGETKVYISTLNIKSFLRRLVDSFGGKAIDKQVSIQLMNDEGADVIMDTDEKKLYHILSNYLSNAIKFAPVGSKVELGHIQEGDNMTFYVKDEGPGIEDKEHKRIFERFYQSANSEEMEEGSGIGLALCKEMALVLSGKVWLTSTPGTGSTFWLSIPGMIRESGQSLLPAFEADIPEVKARTVKSSSFGELAEIILVEDKYEMREFIASELSEYAVRSFENGSEALSFLETVVEEGKKIPDLIVSDVMMPVMDGFELLRKVREHKSLERIPFILLTARAGKEDKLNALRIGVDDYITKPFDIEELNLRVHNLLDRRQSETEFGHARSKEKPMNSEWLKEIENIVRKHIDDNNYTISMLATDLYVSESKLYRRVKSITGLTPNMYIREIRLFEAKRLLEEGLATTVAAVASMVGFEDSDYFSRLYKERFGHRPSRYF